ncbi:uncharacterized protein [Antedon mediterranea]|uniref:uncharacterized protein n=1 Tax=Antedon mediterranea TaxID=105859 RepID=UPI003AF886E5
MMINILWCFIFFSSRLLSIDGHQESSEACDAKNHECTKLNTESSNRYLPGFQKFPLPKPSRVYKTKNNNSSTAGLYVFDNVFNLTSLLILDGYHQVAAKWRYRTSNEHGLPPWSASLNPSMMSSTQFGRRLHQVTASVSENTAIKLSEIELNIVRRQDPIKVVFGSEIAGNEFTAVLYMNEIWRKNDYGDALFYEKGEDMPLASIKPKHGRLLIFDSSIGFLSRPPSVNFRAGQVFLVARFSTNNTRVEEMQERFEAEAEAKEINTKELFQNMPKSDSKIDIGNHFVTKHQSYNGKQILVFDDLFLSGDLEKIKHHVLNYGSYYYDDSFDFESDNVVWIAGFPVDEFVSTRLWPIVKQVASFSSGKDDWFPYDISCNIIRNADSTRIHEDCEDDEEEWTFLLYLNHDWSPDYYGETAFFETKYDDSDLITTVLPKYGRAVIFEGIIPHSARPPSPTFNGARLSFAVKLSVNENVARNKIFSQTIVHELGLHQAALNILKKHDKPEFESSYVNSLLANIDEQRMVDWRLAEYSFRGVTTDNIVQYTSDEEEDDLGEDEDYQVYKERKDFLENLLLKIEDNTDELKHHFDEYWKQFMNFEKEYAEKILKIL